MNRKVSVVLLLTLLAISISFGAVIEVEKTVSSQVEQNNLVTVTIKITPAESQSKFDLVEFVPEDWTIYSWDVSGYNKNDVSYEERAQYYYQGKMRGALHWSFDNGLSNEITLTYSIPARTSGTQELVSVWLYPGGFNSKVNSVSVSAATTVPFCGNGICDAGETVGNCIIDCKVVTVCGNGACEKGENFMTCSKDCPSPFPVIDERGAIALIILTIIILMTYYYITHKKKYVEHKQVISSVIEDVGSFVKGTAEKIVQAPEKPPAPKESYKDEDLVVKRLRKIVKKLKKG